MKKAIIICLVLCLSLGFAFAAKQGDLRFGAQLGYGREMIRAPKKDNPNNVYSHFWNGVDLALTGEYCFRDYFLAKAGFGLNTMGRSTKRDTVGTYRETSACPVNYGIFLGAEFEYVIADLVGLDIGLGLDVMGGRMSAASEAKDNVRIGLGLEFNASYHFTENLFFCLGGRYTLYFINTDKDIRDEIKNKGRADGRNISQSGFRILAGVTYSFSRVEAETN